MPAARQDWNLPGPAMHPLLQKMRMPPRRLVLWHSVAAIPMGTVVILGAYLSYHYHVLAMENRERVDHAYEVLDVVDGLFIAVQNADVAQRDYIVTGDPGRLVPFKAALAQEADDERRLRTLFQASPTQEKRLAALDVAVAARLTELGQTITLRHEQGFDAARTAIQNGDRGKSMDDIRRQVEAIGDAERRLLARRQASGREHERETLLVGIFIACLSVTVRICIALGLRWVHRRRAARGVEGEAAPSAG